MAIDGVPRRPVLAVGSNASPSQLRRKFPSGLGFEEPIPVLRVAVHGLDTVYAAKVAGYGVIPATPYPAPDVTADLHVTFLTDRQLDRMNETEAIGHAYDLVELPDLRVSSAVPIGGRVWCYRSCAGVLQWRAVPSHSAPDTPTVGDSPRGISARCWNTSPHRWECPSRSSSTES